MPHKTVAAVKSQFAILAPSLVLVLHVGLETGDHPSLADGAVQCVGQHGGQGGDGVGCRNVQSWQGGLADGGGVQLRFRFICAFRFLGCDFVIFTSWLLNSCVCLPVHLCILYMGTK